MDSLREALLAKQASESFREIARAAGVNHAILSHIVNRTRDNVALDTAQALADYLGLELRKTR